MVALKTYIFLSHCWVVSELNRIFFILLKWGRLWWYQFRNREPRSVFGIGRVVFLNKCGLYRNFNTDFRTSLMINWIQHQNRKLFTMLASGIIMRDRNLLHMGKLTLYVSFLPGFTWGGGGCPALLDLFLCLACPHLPPSPAGYYWEAGPAFLLKGLGTTPNATPPPWWPVPSHWLV